MSGKVQTLKLPVEVVAKNGAGAQDDEDDGLQDTPLFSEVEGDRKIAHVLVIRQEPDEGALGRMPPTVTEMEIKRRWGGGTFRLQGRDERNRPLKGAFRTVEIAGDPNFQSEAAAARWRKEQGLDKPATPAGDAIGIKEIFALLNTTEAKQKSEAERRAADLEAQHKRELERIRLEAELRAREREAEDERRERLAEERDERRRREDADREERRRKEDEAARVRDKEFQLQLAQLGRKGSADGSEMLLRGIELARSLGAGGGDGGDDPVTSVAKALLPGVLDKFGGGGAKPPASAAPGAAAAQSANAVTLDGAIGTKAQQVIAHLQAQGYDPEAGINNAFDMLLKIRRKTAPDATPSPAAAAPSSPAAAAAAPVSNGTATVKRRTTKK